MAQAKSIDELERDVEQARARVAADIALIRSPETYESAKSGLMSTVFGYRDEMADKARDSATSFGDGLVESLKAKASANPLAVAAIGAGILWRLYKHPPVTTVLVGLGLTSLLRTDPDDDSMHPRKLMEVATEKAIDYKDRAAAQVQELRESAVGVIEEKFHDAKVAAEHAYESVKESAVNLTSSADEHSASARVSSTPASLQHAGAQPPMVRVTAVRTSADAPRVGEKRDAYLLGVAALAVGAAIGLARRNGASDRYCDDNQDYDDMRETRDVRWRHYS